MLWWKSSTCCLMEACNIVLIYTLLFSIKGQTVQNSTVIPHTSCSQFTPVSYYTVLPCTCTLFTSTISARELQVQHLFALPSLLFIFALQEHEPFIYLSSFFLHPTSKSESCAASWTPLRRRLRPWHLSLLPTWVCLPQTAPVPANLHDYLLSESFYGNCCLLKLRKE